MSEQKKDFQLASMEDAWELAKKEGYTGSLEEFDALCKKAAEDLGSQDEAMDPESLETVAGGKNVLKAIGDWCADNKDLLIATGSALTAAAVTYGVMRYKQSQTKGEGPVYFHYGDDDSSSGSGIIQLMEGSY